MAGEQGRELESGCDILSRMSSVTFSAKLHLFAPPWSCLPISLAIVLVPLGLCKCGIKELERRVSRGINSILEQWETGVTPHRSPMVGILLLSGAAEGGMWGLKHL